MITPLRILSYDHSRRLTQEELELISATGTTNYATANASYSSGRGWDSAMDVTFDM